MCDIRATHYTFAKPACLVACGGCMFHVKAVSAMIGNGPVRNINLSSTAKGELSLLCLFVVVVVLLQLLLLWLLLVKFRF